MIEREDHGEIAVVRLIHGKANAMDLEFCEAITAAVRGASDAGAIILTGSGNIFSAGVDLFRVVDEGRAYLERFLPALSECFDAVFNSPRPVVAAANGHAIAGGGVLLCAADCRLMATGKGRVGVPELYVGVPFPPIAMEILRFAVAPGHLQTVVLGGETVGPEEALRRGLVDELVDPHALFETALERASRLASVPGDAFTLTKRQLHESAMERSDASAQTTGAEVTEQWLSEAALERIGDYLERTFGQRTRS